MFYASGTNRGLLYLLTRNLARLTDVYRTRLHLDDAARQMRAGKWDPQNPIKSTKVPPKATKTVTKKEAIQLSGWSALGEVVLAAEADRNIHLGRQSPPVDAFFKRRTIKRSPPRRRAVILRSRVVSGLEVRPKDLRIGMCMFTLVNSLGS